MVSAAGRQAASRKYLSRNLRVSSYDICPFYDFTTQKLQSRLQKSKPTLETKFFRWLSQKDMILGVAGKYLLQKLRNLPMIISQNKGSTTLRVVDSDSEAQLGPKYMVL